MITRRALLALAALPFLAQAASASETPEAFVRALYEAHLPKDKPDAAGILADPALLRRMLVADLAAAIEQDAAESAKTQEIGKLDFDPLTASQDPFVDDLKVSLQDSAADRPVVQADFGNSPDGGSRTVVTFDLVRAGDTWQVHDIRVEGAEGWSLRQIMGLS